MPRAKPLTSMFLGLIFGVALAVILQQAGVWPLDKLTVFLLPGIIALIFVLIQRIGRAASTTALVIALVLLIAPIAYGLTGLGELNESGELNGGCTVEAASDIDTTIVTDTSRSEPFDVEPDGGLTWFATSPGPILDHEWEIWVVIGGFEYVVADNGEEREPNTDMDQDNIGDEPSLRGYVEDLGFRSGEQIQGVFEVGGFIDGDGGACDGFGFVRVSGDFLGTIIYWIAFIIALLALIIYLILVFVGRNAADAEDVDYAKAALAGTAVTGLPGAAEDDEDAPRPGERPDSRGDDGGSSDF
mgnify:FL=1